MDQPEENTLPRKNRRLDERWPPAHRSARQARSAQGEGETESAEGLLGELIKVSMRQIKDTTVPFSLMRQAEQAAVLERVENDLREILTEAIDVMVYRIAAQALRARRKAGG